jgi:tetratricopeptide (TPR) repeat protein
LASTLDQALRGATKLEKTNHNMGALKLIENALSKWPESPRLIERRNHLREAITKAEAHVNPPAFVLEKLASLFDLQQWSNLDRICGELIRVHPISGQIINIFAVAKREIGDIDAALSLHRRAISIDPENPSFLLNLGNTLVASDAYDDAIQCFLQVIELDPTMPSSYNSLGACYEDLGDNAAAHEYYTRALKVDQDYADASYNLGATKLRDLDFKNGWMLRDTKWLKPKLRKSMEEFDRPMWSGLKTGRLFIWAEQGIGDEVMFASCFEDLSRFADELLVSVSKKSLGLFQYSFPNIEFIERETNVADLRFDDHIPAMSALGIVRQSKSSFLGSREGYLRVETKAVDAIRNELNNIKGNGPIIGISWNSKAKRVGSRRSISITDFVQALPEEALLVNLQYGDVSEDIRLARTLAGRNVHIIPDVDLNDDMQGFCAVILACDRVVSIDNSTVHFAGALSQKCDVLLPFSADWRWGPHNTRQSVWYPSLNLHWQTQSDDWSDTLARVSERLC